MAGLFKDIIDTRGRGVVYGGGGGGQGSVLDSSGRVLGSGLFGSGCRLP